MSKEIEETEEIEEPEESEETDEIIEADEEEDPEYEALLSKIDDDDEKDFDGIEDEREEELLKDEDPKEVAEAIENTEEKEEILIEEEEVEEIKDLEEYTQALTPEDLEDEEITASLSSIRNLSVFDGEKTPLGVPHQFSINSKWFVLPNYSDAEVMIKFKKEALIFLKNDDVKGLSEFFQQKKEEANQIIPEIAVEVSDVRMENGEVLFNLIFKQG